MKGFIRFLRVLAGIAVTAGIIFLIIFFVRHSKPVIYDLRAYLEHSLSGYNGEAVMSVSVNKNSLAEDILPQLKKKDHDAYKALSEAINSGQSGTFIDTLFDMKVSDTEGLSNGDTVTVTFTYDNEALEHYGIAFTGDTGEIAVENLKDIQKLDLFDDLQLDFTGISPYLTTDERIFYEAGDAYVVCSVSPADHLKTGDQVTVTIDPDESELPEGTRAAETSRKITVGAADAFVMTPEELSEKDQERIQSQCTKALQEEGAFENKTVVPAHADESQFIPEDAGLAVSQVHFLEDSVFYADDGSLDCTEVIGQETPDLLALYYECDIVEAEASADPDATAESEDLQAEDGQADAVSDSTESGEEKTGEFNSADGAEQPDQNGTETAADPVSGETQDAEAKAGQKEQAELQEQTVLYHVYGVVFVGHIVRTTENNLTFRIMNQPEYTASAQLYEDRDMLAEAVKDCVGKLPGNLRAAQ